MNSFAVFTAKELKEQIKTFKGIVLFIIMLIFGMTSPLFAKLMPELLKIAGTGGIEIRMPPPTFIDAYSQFFKNISQMVMIVLILIVSNAVVTETLKGTTSIMLTKRLSRSAFILSKFTSYSLVWTVSYLVSAAMCTGYAYYLFPEGRPLNLLLAFFCMWLYGILTISIAILASTILKNYALAAVGSFCLWGLQSLTSAVSGLKEHAPSALQAITLQLISGAEEASSATIPILTCIIFTAIILTCACLYFRRREL